MQTYHDTYCIRNVSDESRSLNLTVHLHYLYIIYYLYKSDSMIKEALAHLPG